MSFPDLPFQIVKDISDPFALMAADGRILFRNAWFDKLLKAGGRSGPKSKDLLDELHDLVSRENPGRGRKTSAVLVRADGKEYEVIVYKVDSPRSGAPFHFVLLVPPRGESLPGEDRGDVRHRRPVEDGIAAVDTLVPEFKGLVGRDPGFRKALSAAQKAARTDLPLLIMGESGTGKEILARSIHHVSDRKGKPFVDINCAAIPDDLIESELFGYESGAFTGARRGGRTGLFEEAHEGTLFMDEIGDSSLKTQAKVLRVLQEGMFKKVGGNKNIRVDVRIISASNKDLATMMREGGFREDLYYRLNTFTIHLPPLRERGRDVVFLVDFFLRSHMLKQKRKIAFSSECMEIIECYRWPGNVRELKGVVDYALTMSNSSLITPEYLPSFLAPRNKQASEKEDIVLTRIATDRGDASSLPTVVRGVEKSTIERALSLARNRSEAIRMLNISRRTFYKKLRQYGLE